MVGKKDTGTTTCQPEEGDAVVALGQAFQIDGGDDDGFAHMKGGGLIVGEIEPVQEAEEWGAPVIRNFSRVAADTGPEEKADAGDDENER